MHAVEVEEIKYSGEFLKDVFIWEVKTCVKHPNSEKLNCTTVEINKKYFLLFVVLLI
jgi:tRNA-binding EMAP/Myf-like protein